jgi:hypothetical protein
MKSAFATALTLVTLSAGQEPQTFTGTISDAMCGRTGHAQMRMGPTDAECTNACVEAHNTAYVLYDAKDTYTLDSGQKLDAFAGRKVTVTGTLDSKTRTLRVRSIAAAGD